MTTTTSPQSLEMTSNLALFGQVVGILLLIILLILFCGWVFKRVALNGNNAQKWTKIISVSHLGAKERLMIVEVDERWLVLGVTPQSITKLHEMAPQEMPKPSPGSFATRFQAALQQQLTKQKNRG